MGIFSIKVPDVGEGIAEAELSEWTVAVGDVIRGDDVIAAVMTDKAVVEIPSSVEGKVVSLGADVGDTIAIGAELIRLEVEGDGNLDESAPPERAEVPEPAAKVVEPPKPDPKPAPPAAPAPVPASVPAGRMRKEGDKPLASPSVRLRAKENGVDLRQVPGSGKNGIITHGDLDAFFQNGGASAPVSGKTRKHTVNEVKVVGLRRKIAERMVLAKTRIPHITIVEEIDVTALEDLRAKLNAERGEGKAKLTILPFLMGAMVRAIAEQPNMNALYDDDAGIVREYGATHIGIASQTPTGLMVPVVRHCEAMSIWDMAAELARVSEAAKSGTATREELSGSTITITSLGALGAIATTPIINHPEVSIVGVNRMAVRPMWDGTEFVPRKMMNLSSSFDHRVIDGWDAAVFVARLKTLLETPAMIFVED